MDNVRSLDEAREKVAETVEKTRKTVKDGLGQAKEKLDEGLKTAKERAQKDLHDTAERARETARQQADLRARQLREGYDRARVEGERWAGEANDYVQENPGKSLILAAIAGFLLGLLLRPRR